MASLVTLLFDDQKLTVDRDKLAKSCKYFHCLLLGQFREAKESEIAIHLDTECVSFELFEAAIDYAVTGVLPDGRGANFYAGMLQLAHIWLYDEMIQVCEEKLLEFVDRKYLPQLHTMANVLKLPRLGKACQEFEYNMGAWAGSEPKKWPGCAFPLHKRRHHYSRCTGFIEKQSPQHEVENWDNI